MIKPNRLQKGDKVMIIAPSSPPKVNQVENMKTKLEGMGLEVVIGKSVYSIYGFLAGEDDVRLADLHEAFGNKEVKGIFCACGGYGSARLLENIDFELIRNNPKIFWGYSDITALHCAIQKYADLVTFHASMMQELGAEDVPEETFRSLEQVWEPKTITIPAGETGVYPSFSGNITAPVIGGNMTVMTSTIGTFFEIDTKGKWLLVEEIDEELYRIDRMFLQLKLAGKFRDAAGLIVGDFTNCLPGKRKESLTLQQIIHDLVVPSGIPIISGFPIGHGKPHIGVPFGTNVTVDGVTGIATFEPGVK